MQTNQQQQKTNRISHNIEKIRLTRTITEEINRPLQWKDIAKRLGVSNSKIYYLIRKDKAGYSKWNADVLQEIAEYLKCDVRSIIGISNEKKVLDGKRIYERIEYIMRSRFITVIVRRVMNHKDIADRIGMSEPLFIHYRTTDLSGKDIWKAAQLESLARILRCEVSHLMSKKLPTPKMTEIETKIVNADFLQEGLEPKSSKKKIDKILENGENL